MNPAGADCAAVVPHANSEPFEMIDVTRHPRRLFRRPQCALPAGNGKIHYWCIPRESSTNTRSGALRHCTTLRAAVWRTPLKLGRRPCVPGRRPRVKPASTSRLLEVAWHASALRQTASPAVRLRLSPTIANSRLLHRDRVPVLGSQPTSTLGTRHG